MDIKTAPERYSVLTGVRNIDIGPVLASVDIIRNSGVEHEFRTTVVNELHSPAVSSAIGQWLKGEERYFLQLFVDSGALIGTRAFPCKRRENARIPFNRSKIYSNRKAARNINAGCFSSPDIRCINLY